MSETGAQTEQREDVTVEPEGTAAVAEKMRELTERSTAARRARATPLEADVPLLDSPEGVKAYAAFMARRLAVKAISGSEGVAARSLGMLWLEGHREAVTEPRMRELEARVDGLAKQRQLERVGRGGRYGGAA